MIRVVFPKFKKKQQTLPSPSIPQRSKKEMLGSLGKKSESETARKKIESNLDPLQQFFKSVFEKTNELKEQVDLKKLKVNSFLITYRDRLGSLNLCADVIIKTIEFLQQKTKNPGKFLSISPSKLKVKKKKFVLFFFKINLFLFL